MGQIGSGPPDIRGTADKTVWLWNVSDPARPARVGTPLTGPTGYVWAVAFSPGGTTLAAGVTDGTVHLWDTPPRRRPRPTSAPARARDSPGRSGRPTSRACPTARPANPRPETRTARRSSRRELCAPALGYAVTPALASVFSGTGAGWL